MYSGKEPYEKGAKIDTAVSRLKLDYKDKSLKLYHLSKIGDVYVYDMYLNVFLYLMEKQTGEKLSFEDVKNDVESGKKELLNKLIVFHQLGGSLKKDYYLMEIEKAYELYESKNNKKYSDKTFGDLEIEDYFGLEEWILSIEEKREEYPTICFFNKVNEAEGKGEN